MKRGQNTLYQAVMAIGLLAGLTSSQLAVAQELGPVTLKEDSKDFVPKAGTYDAPNGETMELEVKTVGGKIVVGKKTYRAKGRPDISSEDMYDEKGKFVGWDYTFDGKPLFAVRSVNGVRPNQLLYYDNETKRWEVERTATVEKIQGIYDRTRQAARRAPDSWWEQARHRQLEMMLEAYKTMEKEKTGVTGDSIPDTQTDRR